MSIGLQTQGKPTPLSSLRPVQIGVLQRKCACGQRTIADAECAESRKKSDSASAKGISLQRAAVNRELVSEVPPIVHEVLRSPGQPLDPATRAFFEPRFGHDFSHVRVHTDTRAAESARAVNALAYTVGRDLVFAEGRFSHRSTAGRWLLAHELTHVVQQADSTWHLAAALNISGSGSLSEREAQQAATSIVESSGAPSAGRPVFLCSKAVALGQRHAFFRLGSAAAGNPTFELEHDEYGEHCTCGIQGRPTRDYPEDVTADARCVPAPMITEACLLKNWTTYPIGKYCALGPNSNTYTRFLAEECGAPGLRPPGSVPGFDDSPPASGTANPALDARLTFLPGACQTIDCSDDTCKRIYF